VRTGWWRGAAERARPQVTADRAASASQSAQMVAQHDPLTAPDGPGLSYETYEALGLAKTAAEKSRATHPNPNQPFDPRVEEMMAERTAVHEAHNVQSGGTEPYSLGHDSLPKAGVPPGRIVGHTDWMGGPDSVYPGVRRDWWIWVPQQYDDSPGPCSVMVFTDGQTYLSSDGDVRAATVLANLIDAGEMPVTIGIFITPGLREVQSTLLLSSRSLLLHLLPAARPPACQPASQPASPSRASSYLQDPNELTASMMALAQGHPEWPTKRTDDTDGTRALGFCGLRDTPQRSFEYDSCTDMYVRFLLQDILPIVEEDFALSPSPSDRAIVGISSGAYASSHYSHT
jgi:hypothetical protein